MGEGKLTTQAGTESGLCYCADSRRDRKNEQNASERKEKLNERERRIQMIEMKPAVS